MISESKKQTMVKVFFSAEKINKANVNAHIFYCGKIGIFIGDIVEWRNFLSQSEINDYFVENSSRNSAIPLLDLKNKNRKT